MTLRRPSLTGPIAIRRSVNEVHDGELHLAGDQRHVQLKVSRPSELPAEDGWSMANGD
ncbi:hypothetical protein [Pendulispora albinea]|uniref:Uncharacterized protein n=1 Tax=Pendulispora albinea TaxID=2741071 RepID=A0ABZ2M6V4_9BACT